MSATCSDCKVAFNQLSPQEIDCSLIELCPTHAQVEVLVKALNGITREAPPTCPGWSHQAEKWIYPIGAKAKKYDDPIKADHVWSVDLSRWAANAYQQALAAVRDAKGKP